MNAPNITAWLIIALGIAAAWHAIIEVIVLPTVRQTVRFKLFALRDQLRALKAEHPDECEDEAFHMLDDSLSWRMDNLPRLAFRFVHDWTAKVKATPSLAKEVERRLAVLESCKLPDYVTIQSESNKLTLEAIAFNSIGWAIYLLPVVYAMTVWEKIATAARRVNVMPEDDVAALKLCPA